MSCVMEWKMLPKVADDLKTQLLHNRGIRTKKEIGRFFKPEIKDYQKDLEIQGIPKAKQQILRAIKVKQQIIDRCTR